MSKQRAHIHISQLNHDACKYAPCSYRSLLSIGSNLQQQTDQLPQLSSRKGKYIAPLNIGEGFISSTSTGSGRRVLLQACCFTHHFLRSGLSCVWVLFCDIVPRCYLPLPVFSFPFGIWFFWPKTCQGYQCLFHHPCPPFLCWFVFGPFVWVLFFLCPLAFCAVFPSSPSLPFLSLFVPGSSD